MKNIYLIFFTMLLCSTMSWAANYAPASQSSFTGAATYCQNGTASALTFTYNTCSGGFLASGVSCTIKWYYNSTNSTATSGATLVATNTFTCATSILGATTGSQTYTPVTTATGSRYYFCVITWSASSCNSANILTSSTTQLVTVNAAPTTVTATASPTTLCSGSTLTLSGSVSGGTGSTYSWTGPGYGGSTSLNPAGFAVNTSGSGIYTLTVATSGCSNIVRTTSSVTVNTAPTGVTAGTNPTVICSGSAMSLTGAASGATSYSWSGPGYAGSSVLNPPSFTSSLANAGVFTLTATNSCGSTQATVTPNIVTTPPSAVAATATPSVVCAGSNLTLTSTATNATSFSWAGPLGSGYSSAVQNPATFATSASYNGVFTVTATNGCGSTTATVNVSVGALPTITSTYTPEWVCAPLGVFSEGWESGVPTSSGTPVDGWSTSATTASWYSQQSSASFPSITGGHSGTYFCKFNSYSLSTTGEAYGALRSPSFSMVGVTAGARVYFWMYREVGGSYPASGGYGTEGFKIYINTTTSTSGATQLGWIPRASDASPTGVNGTANPSSSGWYRYYADIPASFTGATNYIFFSGVSAWGDDCYLDDISLVKFQSRTMSITASGGTWSSSDPTIASVGATTGIVAGISTGTATISYSVPGCALPATKTIGVVDATPAITAAGGVNRLCQSSTLALSSTYPGGTWSSSNSSIASVSSSGVVTGAGVGAATITYAQGCGTAATYTVSVIGSPAAISGTSYVCQAGSVTLSDATTGFTWSTNDPTIATINASSGMVTGVAAGSTTITYSTGCGIDATMALTVNPSPSSISGVTSVCTLSTASFTNASSGISSSWSNTPATYGTINPSSGVFTSNSSTGTTTITYTVNYATGSCYATMPLVVSNASPAAISPATVSICTGAAATLTDATPGGAWSVDPASAAIATISSGGVVTGLSQGVATISYSACGSVTRSVTVTGYSGTVSSNTPVCTGGALSLTSSISPTPVYSWTGPSGFISVLASPSRTSAVPGYSGVYTLSVTTGGCARTFTTSVTVSPLSMSITPASGAFCAGASTSLVATVGGAATPVNLSEGWEIGVPTVPGTAVDGWNTTATTTSWYSQQSSGSYPSISSGHTGSKFCKFNSYSINPTPSSYLAYGALISPSFSMVGMNGTLSFWMYREVGGSYTTGAYLNEGFNVYINTTNSVTGGTLLGFVPRVSTANPTGLTGTANPSASGWYQYSISIPAAYSGATNYILFEGISAYGDDCYLDDINITTTVVPVTWSPATRLYTNSALTAPYSGSAATTVYAAPVSSVNYSATVGTCVVTAPITVADQPSIASLTPSASTICAGQSMSLSASTAGGLGTAVYTWSGAGITTTTGSSATSPSFTPATTGAGAYSLSLSYSGTGCTTATRGTTVTTNALPVASAVSAPSLYCLGSGTPLTLNTSVPASGAGSLVSYNWSGPNGFSTTTAPGAPSVSFTPVSTAAAGVYSLTVTYSSASCTSAVRTTAAIPVGNQPQSQSVTGGNGCSGTGGTTVGINGSEVGMTYKLIQSPSTVVSTLPGTGTILSFLPVSSAGTYIVKANDLTGCVTTMSGADTILATPVLSLGDVPSVCEGADMIAVPYSTSGSPVLYSIDWNTAANTAGIPDVANAALGGGILGLSIPTSGALGNFSGNITVMNGFCPSTSTPVNITIYATPVVSLTSVNTPCVNHMGSIEFSGTDSAIVDYRVDGGPTNHFTFSGTTHSLSTGLINSAHTYQVLNAHNPVCSTTSTDVATVTPIPMQWTGGASGHTTDWSHAANWTCGFEPGNTDDVTISSSSFTPVIPASHTATVKSLTVAPGASLAISNSAVLNIANNMTNAGTISGNGKVVLNGTAPQVISGSGTINNLELNNSNGAAIDTGSKVWISKALYITQGTFTTNDSLELTSNDTMPAARIAELPSTGAAISGKVTVARYIQAGYRRFRFLAHPFNAAMSLSQLQQYMDITGTGGAANGFTTTASNAASAFRFDPLTSNDLLSYDPGWKAITRINGTETDVNKLNPGQGMRIFFRGAKGEGLSYSGYFGMYTPSADIIKMSGFVNQGAVTVTLSQGSSNPDHQSFNMIGNPYPSPVDIGTILYDARNAGEITGSAFYIWNPSIGVGGQYMTVPIGTTSATPYYIEACGAFQVQAAHNGAVLHFYESDKGGTYDNNLFKAPSNSVRLAIYDKNYHLWDMLSLQFNDKASDKEDKNYDAAKPMGTDFNFYSLSADGRNLAIDARPYNENAIIPLGVASNYQEDFIVRAEDIKGAPGIVILHDKLLNKYIEMNAGTEYAFSITKDKATQGNDRLELSFKPENAATGTLSVSMSPNPATDDVKITYTSNSSEPVSLKLMDMNGVSVYAREMGIRQGGVVTVPMGNFATGIYMVELSQGDHKTTKKLVKE